MNNLLLIKLRTGNRNIYSRLSSSRSESYNEYFDRKNIINFPDSLYFLYNWLFIEWIFV